MKILLAATGSKNAVAQASPPAGWDGVPPPQVQTRTRTTVLRRSEHGVSLIECLAYIALVTVVLGLASSLFFRCWDDSKHLRRNAEDIVRALHAGEQWRADVRTASGPIRVTDDNNTENMIIPVRAGKIIYSCAAGVLSRQGGSGAPAIVELEHVKSSRMQTEPRSQVTAWRWELALQPGQKQVRMLPLFTFETVAGQNTVP